MTRQRHTLESALVDGFLVAPPVQGLDAPACAPPEGALHLQPFTCRDAKVTVTALSPEKQSDILLLGPKCMQFTRTLEVE